MHLIGYHLQLFIVLTVSFLFPHEKILNNVLYYGSVEVIHLHTLNSSQFLCFPVCCQLTTYCTIITSVSYEVSCCSWFIAAFCSPCCCLCDRNIETFLSDFFITTFLLHLQWNFSPCCILLFHMPWCWHPIYLDGKECNKQDTTNNTEI